MPLLPLQDRSVLVTGSSSGIGKETAFAFAREKARVVVTYREEKSQAEEVARRCKELGAPEVLLFHLNVTDGESIKDVAKQTSERFGEITILINNAGIALWKPLSDLTFDEIELQLKTNVEGLIEMTKTCLPSLSETVINIGSGAGLEGFADLTVYCATKFAVRGFSKALAKERGDLRIYTVNPGITATRLTNYQGVSAEEVAMIILNAAKGVYPLPSGSDINVWEHI